MSKPLKGRFRPRNPDKYKGNPMLIEYRSSWERNFMNWLDTTSRVVQWASEEKAIWYFDPVTKKKRRYFPDFIVAYENKDGHIMKEVIEIKPARQTVPPPANPKRRTQSWYKQWETYATNKAKWDAAVTWASGRGMSFRLLTEKDVPGWSGSALMG